jgi:hypothetical protein
MSLSMTLKPCFTALSPDLIMYRRPHCSFFEIRARAKTGALTLPSPAKRARVRIELFDRKIPSPIPMLIVTHNPYGWRLEDWS